MDKSVEELQKEIDELNSLIKNLHIIRDNIVYKHNLECEKYAGQVEALERVIIRLKLHKK